MVTTSDDRGVSDVSFRILDCDNKTIHDHESTSIYTVEIVIRRTSDVHFNEDGLRDLLRKKREELINEISSMIEL
jgi:uncharacterized protein YqeY